MARSHMKKNANRNSKMRYHLTSIKMDTIQSLQITNTGESVKKREHCYTVSENVGNVIWSSHYLKQYRGPSEN